MNIKIKYLSIIVLLLLFVYSNSCIKKETIKVQNPISGPNVTDIDGNVYHSIVIGSQTWMAENLKVTKYRNGDLLLTVTDSTPWSSFATGANCSYNNEINNTTTYGLLYNWYAVNDSRKIAPVGWHVPTDAEWKTLIDNLGGEGVAGGKLKEVGYSHWVSPNYEATNTTGFTALPGGNCDNGDFHFIGEIGFWWSSTVRDSNSVWVRYLSNYDNNAPAVCYTKDEGLSVRCIKD